MAEATGDGDMGSLVTVANRTADRAAKLAAEVGCRSVDWGARHNVLCDIVIMAEDARIADSGFEIRYYFCPNCGSTIFAEGDRTPEFCAVPAGCFADLSLPAPTISVWEESMHSWLAVASVAEHHRRDRTLMR